MKDESNNKWYLESTHLMVHPDYIPSRDLVDERFRPGKKRNDVCLIKMEHDATTLSYMSAQNFPGTPCRLEPVEDFEKVLL